MELNTIQSAVYILVQRFVQRQSLVLEAMRELRPDLVMRIEHKGNSEFWARWTPETWQAFVLENVRKHNSGDWGKNGEWAYFLHGTGCRLTHKVNQERIQWDLGSLYTFDRSWFVDWVQSLLNQAKDDNVIAIVRAWDETEEKRKPGLKPSFRPLDHSISPILEQLHQMGLLSQQHQYYTLISPDENARLER